MRGKRLRWYGLIGIIGMIAVLLLIRTLPNLFQKEEKEIQGEKNDPMNLGEAISRIDAYRMLSFLLYDQTERKKQLSEESVFTDLTIEEEAYEYFWISRKAGFFSEEIKEARPKEAMTCGEFRDALFALCKNDLFSYADLLPNLPDRLKTVQEKDELLLSEFLFLYQSLLKQLETNLGKENPIKELEAYILAEESMIEDAKEDAKERKQNPTKKVLIYSSEGKTLELSFCRNYLKIWDTPLKDEGLFTELVSTQYLTAQDCLDRTLRFLVRGKEIICCIGEGSGETILYNALIQSGTDTNLTFYAEGILRQTQVQLPLSEEISSTIGDITLTKGIVTAVTIKPEVVNGKVLMADKKQIEVEGYGRLPLDENYRIYKIYGELSMEQTSSILVGYTTTDFVVANGKICSVLLKEKIRAETIRVLIKTTGYTSNYHESVTLTANRAFHVTSENKTTDYEKGENLTYTAEQIEKEGGRIRIFMDSENGKISLNSVKRAYGIPAYRGSIELASDENGILIVNELPLEEYLYAVIPSEMPTSYGMEALKAQAVCARSYAYNQLIANRYSAYGAHVDDSVNCQVYNNSSENETSILAVKETYGKVAEYAGKIITTYYFSTSFGHTANVEDVWESGNPTAYLTGSLQNDSDTKVDLTKEEAFRNFLFSDTISSQEVKEVIKTYDSDISWYRWKVTISAKDLSKQVEEKLIKQYQAGKSQILTKVSEKEAKQKMENEEDLILYKVGNETYLSCKPKEIGTIQKAEIIERGAGGIALSLRLTGTKETVLIRYQTNIRTLLAPNNDILYRQDESQSKGMSLLPSAFIAIDPVTEDGEDAFLITGGGYGHGLGMSQNGANTMAKEGKSYEEILKHFYPDTGLEFLYDDLK